MTVRGFSAFRAVPLRKLGVDVLQGYHFGQPMSRSDFLTWLASGQPTPAGWMMQTEAG